MNYESKKLPVELVADPRDVVQSLDYHLDSERYIQLLVEIAKAGFPHIMIGSLINKKLVPAMADTVYRAEEFYRRYPEDSIKRQILIFKPSSFYIEQAQNLVEKKAINSISYTHSLFAEFLYANNGIGRQENLDFNLQEDRRKIIMLSRERIEKFVQLAKQMEISIDIHMSKIAHGLDSERRDLILSEIAKEIPVLNSIMDGVKGRIVLSDTSAEATPETFAMLSEVLASTVKQHRIVMPVGFHLHTNPQDNEGLREFLLKGLAPIYSIIGDTHENISLDIGFGGVGGCPFDTENPKANLQAKNLIEIDEHLQKANIELIPELQEETVKVLDEAIAYFLDLQPQERLSTLFKNEPSI